jgi:hypothetical protein
MLLLSTVALAIGLYAGALFAQTPVPVDTGFSINPLALLIVVVALIGVGLYIWHRKNPSQETAALHDANAKMLAEIQKGVAALNAKLNPQAAPAAPAGPTAEQLAAIKAKEDELAQLKAQAGV